MAWRNEREERLVVFIRTKLIFKHRLKDLKNYDTVKIYVYELDKLGLNHGPMLWSLKQRGDIWYDSHGNFKVRDKAGPIDPSLLQVAKRKKVTVPLTPLHIWMREHLKSVSLSGVKRGDIPVYFRAFMDNKDKDVAPFFSVDAFSNRVHTPVVNLKGSLRFKIRFYGDKVVSLDVKQMQPTILAKVLYESIGKNSFSDTIDEGKDVYDHLQGAADLESRHAAKKYLFQLIFGKPSSEAERVFKGDSSWVEWINKYKSQEEPNNPHKQKKHTNLAWLLQYSEVQVMTGLWKKLMNRNIPFLTIHDEVMCRPKDETEVKELMEAELKLHFKTFEINVTC